MASFVRDPGPEHRHDGLDPVTASASALAHGRIGLVAWAIFERGDGLVLSFEKQGEHFTIEVDTPAEKDGALRFQDALCEGIRP